MKKSIEFNLLVFIISVIGVVVNICLFKSLKGFLYFTIYSNCLAVLYYGWSLFCKIKNSKNKIKNLKGMVLVSLLLTSLIFNLYLVPTHNAAAYNNHFVASFFVHVLTPGVVLIDSILGFDNIAYKKKDIIFWSVGMFVYGMIIVIYQMLGGLFLEDQLYPYIIYNYIDYGILGCLLMNVAVYIIYVILSLIVIKINNYRNKKANYINL